MLHSRKHTAFGSLPILAATLVLLLHFTGCSQDRTSDWRKMECGLFMSPDGKLGFATDPDIANVPRSELEGERCENVFLTTFGWDTKQLLSSVIDTATFELLSGSFSRDKGHIYHYYAMCEGGYLNLFADDTSSFRLIGNCYAFFQGHIYHERNGLMDADAETFQVLPKFSCIAKDKNGYFEYNERVSEEELRNQIGEERFEELKNL